MHLRPTALKSSPLPLPNPQNPQNPRIHLLRRATAMKDHPMSNGTYCVPQRRLSSVIVSSSSSSTRSLDSDWRENHGGLASNRRNESHPFHVQPMLQDGRYASDDYSDDESDHETEPSSNKISM